MTYFSKRVNRLVKSYAPIRNALTYALGIDNVLQQPITVYCKYTKQYLPADEFYVKKYTQDKDPKVLSNKDFRHISKKIWDEKVKNRRAGLGWKTDEEVAASKNTLEMFLNEDA